MLKIKAALAQRTKLLSPIIAEDYSICYNCSMSVEIPPKEVIEATINSLNGQLESIGQKAKDRGLIPIDLDKLPVPDDIYELLPTQTTSGFWSHHIAGHIAATVDLPPRLSYMTGDVQKTVYMLANAWMEHPTGRSDQLNLASCRAFLAAGFTFDWITNPDLLLELANTTGDLGDQYSLREGRIPLGYFPLPSSNP